jgi:hypothetical protein
MGRETNNRKYICEECGKGFIHFRKVKYCPRCASRLKKIGKDRTIVDEKDLRFCSRCHVKKVSHKGAYYCVECDKNRRQERKKLLKETNAVYKEHICATCGEKYMSCSNGKYCPKCKKSHKPQCNKTRKAKCPVCGKIKIVRGNNTLYCADCRPDAYRALSKLNRELKKNDPVWQKRCNERRREARQKTKHQIVEHYTKGKMCCQMCGENYFPMLQVDHIKENGFEERKNLHGSDFFRYIIRNNFPDDYQILCAVCNIKKHWDYLKKYEKERLEHEIKS